MYLLSAYKMRMLAGRKIFRIIFARNERIFRIEAMECCAVTLHAARSNARKKEPTIHKNYYV